MTKEAYHYTIMILWLIYAIIYLVYAFYTIWRLIISTKPGETKTTKIPVIPFILCLEIVYKLNNDKSASGSVSWILF